MKAGTKVILAAALLAILLLAGKLFLSEASFSPANLSWDGLSSTMGDNARPLYGLDQLPPDGRQSTLLVVGPSVNYTADEAARVRAFLGQGGRVVVLDDFGTANSLLSGIGSPITVRHTPLCQDVDYYRNPNFSIVGHIGASELTANVSRLVFNHPAPLEAGDGAEVLARTTMMGWLDANGNGRVDGDEKFSSYPLLARASLGNGELYVAGDADLAINSMRDQGDDGVLAGNIARAGMVYIDVGHGQGVPPLAGLYYTVKYNIVVQILFALLIFILGYAYVVRARIFERIFGRNSGSPEPEEEAPDARGQLIAAMKARLPLSGRELEEIEKKL